MDFWTEYGGSLGQLALYALGIVVYTVLVTILYVPMGHRLMFAKQLGEERIATPGRRLAYVFLFPFVSFAFFLVVAGAMVFLSSFSTQGLSHRDVLTLSMAIVLAIRICAYINETASDELAKVMPLGLLGVVLVTGNFTSLADSLARLRVFVDDGPLVGVFFVVVVAVEFLLRLAYELLGRPGHRQAKPALRPK